jgi:hypothetical protein
LPSDRVRDAPDRGSAFAALRVDGMARVASWVGVVRGGGGRGRWCGVWAELGGWLDGDGGPAGCGGG